MHLEKSKKSQRKLTFLHISLQPDNQISDSNEREAAIEVKLLIVVLEYGLLA